MASTEPDPAVEQLIAFLTPKNVAIYAQTREEWARSILEIVLNRVADRWRSANIGTHPTFQLATEALKAVVQSADAPELAINNKAAAQDVHRILNIINAVAHTQWGRFAAMAQQPKSRPEGQSAHRAYRIIPQLGHTQWSESIQDHALLLRKAFDTVHHSHVSTRPDTLVISLQDWGMLREGVEQLGQKIIRNCGKRADKTTLYQSPTGLNTALVPNARAVPGARLVELSHAAQATAAHMLPSSTTQNLPQMAKHPIAPKHIIPRSPGTSPVKKKTKDVPLAHKEMTFTHNDGAYYFFVLAEREQVKGDVNKNKDNSRGITGEELSSLLAELWARMLAEEKAPFAAIYHKWQEKEPSDQQVLAAGEYQRRGIDDNVRAIARKRMVVGMKRCKTVLNARDVFQFLKSKNIKPTNPLTRNATAAAPHITNVAPTLPNGLSSHPPFLSSPKDNMGPPPRSAASISRFPGPSTRHPSRRVPLQTIPPSYTRQRSQQTASSMPFLSEIELLRQAKQVNASMEKMIARSSTAGNYIDLTENDPPSP
ncbi:uncharacterized protein K460DRAFT_354694 [Cucurbitaria berberidis CBS 394.84]|uniref:Uncharacterized protein n=1 Tax=Cucurbitaria berberidis CBS 394.84 TaxID=1168544 RepID=A0A9P4GFS4_9PLEO|nr:uncharacterized protein K460DRAFT_354694 [Cucurbitaria berberidis CBS 394.84]KAF1844817.1 hypothetical protein K460DRAFT_354694 [Cucurbitaria berberidis CBS 394.84]